MISRVRDLIQKAPINLLKMNVYGFSILPSALISRLFHHKVTRFLGLGIFCIFFAQLNRDYRKFAKVLARHLRDNGKCHAQQLQDVAALAFGSGQYTNHDEKFFLDIGAAYPFKYSNSAELQRLGWHGVLVDPNPTLYEELLTVRSSANVKVLRCAIGDGSEVPKLLNSGPLSSLIRAERTDIYDFLRNDISSNMEDPLIDVEIIKPLELLEMCDAPRKIQMLSIDTEGNELGILQKFPFDKYEVDFVTCEHNFEWKKLSEIESLMQWRGYRRIMSFWSAQDAWFIKT